MKTYRLEIINVVNQVVQEVLEVTVIVQSNQEVMKALYERVHNWCVNMGVCPDDYDYEIIN